MLIKKKVKSLMGITLLAAVMIVIFGFNTIETTVQSLTLDVNAKSAILVDYDTGKVMFERKANKQLPPASMSKIMVEYLVLKEIHHHQLSWKTPIKISHYAYTISSTPGFSHVPLVEGQSYSTKDLYDAMAIHSANGATIALAEKLSGSEADFVKLMNQTARELGLTHTRYVNSTGLNNSDLGSFYSVGAPHDGNLTTALDLSKLAENIIKNYPEALHVSGQAVKAFGQFSNKPSHTIYNTNMMLPENHVDGLSYPGVDGLKTGFTRQAGYCFTGTAYRKGHRLITVVMGAKTKTARFKETKKLLDFGFSHLGHASSHDSQ